MSHQQRRPTAAISLIHSQPDVIMWTHLARSSAHVSQFITFVYRVGMWLNYGGLNDLGGLGPKNVMISICQGGFFWNARPRFTCTLLFFRMFSYLVSSNFCHNFSQTRANYTRRLNVPPEMVEVRECHFGSSVPLQRLHCFTFSNQARSQKWKQLKSGFWFRRTLAWK